MFAGHPMPLGMALGVPLGVRLGVPLGVPLGVCVGVVFEVLRGCKKGTVENIEAGTYFEPY